MQISEKNAVLKQQGIDILKIGEKFASDMLSLVKKGLTRDNV